MKKCVLIINPNSGKDNRTDYLFDFHKLLAKYNYETVVYFTNRGKHASAIILELPNDIDLVISMGGDGTFNEVVSGNLKRKVQLLLAHIPSGTTNDVGSMFGYEKEALKNLKMTLDGVVREMDICMINKIPFVYVAGFGKFMNIPYETPRDLKEKFGKFAYIAEGIKSFTGATPLYDLTYTADGKTYTGRYSFMLISNATRIAGINNFYKDIKLDDNKFEVIFCNLTKKSDIISALYYLATSNLTACKGFEFHRLSELDIKFSKPNNSWCIDGEQLTDETDEYKLEIVKDFKILMPKKNVRKLFSKKGSEGNED